MGAITELTALQRSSNVYMFHVAMHIAGITYVGNAGDMHGHMKHIHV